MRWSEGTLPTDRQFTGQRLEAGLGLYDYQARYYDPGIGRFVQPDTVVPRPGNPQSLNRYSYVDDNPLRYTDPSGHMFIACGDGESCGDKRKLPGQDTVSILLIPTPTPFGQSVGFWFVPPSTPVPALEPPEGNVRPTYLVRQVTGDQPGSTGDPLYIHSYVCPWKTFSGFAGGLSGKWPALGAKVQGGAYHHRIRARIEGYSNGVYVLVSDEYDTTSLNTPLVRRARIDTSEGSKTEYYVLGVAPPRSKGKSLMPAGFWIPRDVGSPKSVDVSLALKVESSLMVPFIMPNNIAPWADYRVYFK